jgi:hypothetical protein
LPSFFAASISAGVTSSAGGAAAFSGSANTRPAADTADALMRSRLVHLLFGIASSLVTRPFFAVA